MFNELCAKRKLSIFMIRFLDLHISDMCMHTLLEYVMCPGDYVSGLRVI